MSEEKNEFIQEDFIEFDECTHIAFKALNAVHHPHTLTELKVKYPVAFFYTKLREKHVPQLTIDYKQAKTCINCHSCNTAVVVRSYKSWEILLPPMCAKCGEYTL
jgi:hypothetical protein